jgi:hypothetical protein
MPARSTGGFRWRKEEERGKQVTAVGFGSILQGKHGSADGRERGGEREGSHERSSRRRAAPACLMGWRGSRSGSTARRGVARGGQRKRRGGGRKDRATRGTGSGWCRAAGAREAAGGGGHARVQRSRVDRGLGEDDGGPGCKK